MSSQDYDFMSDICINEWSWRSFSAIMLYFVILHHNLEYDAIYDIVIRVLKFKKMQNLIFWGQALHW